MTTVFLWPRLPHDTWREDAACASHPEPWLWDAVRYDGEPRRDREDRHRAAKRVCFTACPVRDQCLADVDPVLDEGVRGGRLLRDNRFDLRLKPCPECAQPTTVNKMSRHRQTHSEKAS